ncbi:MAG: ubiquinol-cytochrome c reductase iron-sulfur subunit [Chloroflexota bacterium]
MAKSPHVTRNEFAKAVVGVLGGIMGAVIGLPAVGYLVGPFLKVQTSDAWIPAGPLENFPVGVPTPFSFTRTKVNGWERTANSYGVYVYRTSETETLVLSNICTHLACRVKWQEEGKIYHCPCHDADFGPQGEIIRGPQDRPLNQLNSKVENGALLIEFKG